MKKLTPISFDLSSFSSDLAWEDFPKEKKNQFKSELLKNQNYRCGYCEQLLKEGTSHIEHIKPKSKFPNLKFTSSNMIVCCSSISDCAHHKGDKYIDNFVSPYENPNAYFKHSYSGELFSMKGEDVRFKDSFENILNLNSRRLVKIRKDLINRMKKNYENFKNCGDELGFETLRIWYADNFTHDM